MWQNSGGAGLGLAPRQSEKPGNHGVTGSSIVVSAAQRQSPRGDLFSDSPSSTRTSLSTLARTPCFSVVQDASWSSERNSVPQAGKVEK